MLPRNTLGLLGLVALFATTVVALPCPPFGFDSVQNLDLSKYVSGAWHVQLQANGFSGWSLL
jgi:hypothetical protein